MHCDRVAIPPRCVCDEQFDSQSCSSCALGYTRRGDRCVPDALDCRDDPCGSRGSCESSSEGDACNCDDAYTGNRCGTCADGYQDHDRDGVCREACGVAPLSCIGRSVCGDDSGVARCSCPNGYTGEHCDECEAGYRRLVGLPDCVTTCASPDVSCTEQGTCIEGPTGAECQCSPGWAGPACEQCDTGYTETEAGKCVAPVPTDTDFWSVVETEGRQWLATVSRPTWQLKVIAPLTRRIDAVAYDGAEAVLYGLSDGELVRIDPSTGEVELIASYRGELGTTLTFDSTRRVLYSASDSELFEIDPAGPAVDRVAARGAIAIEYDPAAEHVLLLEQVAQDPQLLRLVRRDPESGEVADEGLLGVSEQTTEIALAVDPQAGCPYLMERHLESPTDALRRYCRQVSRAMAVIADGSEVLGEYGDEVAPGESRTLNGDGTNPPLFVYGSEGDRADEPATLRIASRHPDAVVCIVTREQPLEVVVEADARLRLLVISSDENTVSVQVEAGFVPGNLLAEPIRTHASGSEVPTVTGADGLHAHFDADAWSELGLGEFDLDRDVRTQANLGPLSVTASAAAPLRVDAGRLEVVGALASFSQELP